MRNVEQMRGKKYLQSNMSTEQSTEPQQPQQPQEQEQFTTPMPETQPKTKNPKRVAAGKMVAERMRLAREAQK